MRIPIFKRLSANDILDVTKLLVPLNSFFEIVRQALTRNLTFSENISCQIKQMQFSTPSTYSSGGFTPFEFALELPSRPTGVLALQVWSENSYPASSVGWEDLGNGNIKINFISGLTNSTMYNVRLLII